MIHARPALFERDELPMPDSATGIQIDFPSRGDFRLMRFMPQPQWPPGPGEVRLRVLATGVNFRDVLNVLGMYPGDPGPVASNA